MAIDEDKTVCVDTLAQALDRQGVGKTERLLTSTRDENQANDHLLLLQVVVPDRDSIAILRIICRD